MYKGQRSSNYGYGRKTYPVYAFKKGDEKAIFINQSETEVFTGVLKESQKADLLDYIWGASELETKLLKNDFRFNALKDLMSDYNAWVKNGKK